MLIPKPVVSSIKCKKYLKTHQKEKKKPRRQKLEGPISAELSAD